MGNSKYDRDNFEIGGASAKRFLYIESALPLPVQHRKTTGAVISWKLFRT